MTDIVEKLEADARKAFEAAQQPPDRSDEADGDDPDQPRQAPQEGDAEGGFASESYSGQLAPEQAGAEFRETEGEAPQPDDSARFAEFRREIMAQIDGRLAAALVRIESAVDTRFRAYAAQKPDVSPESVRTALSPTAEEREALGEDFAEAIQSMLSRALGSVVDAVVHELAPRFGEVQTTVDQVRQNAVRHRVFSELTVQVPDWQEINRREDWKQWLDRIDDLSGTRRQDLLMGHLDAGRTVNLVNMFRAFKREAGLETGGSRPAAVQKVPLAAMAAPTATASRPAASAPPPRLSVQEYARQAAELQRLELRSINNPVRLAELAKRRQQLNARAPVAPAPPGRT